MKRAKRRKLKHSGAPSDGRTVRLTPYSPRLLAGSENINPKCYAQCLGGCSPKISDEHFISYEVLMKLCRDDRGLYVRGVGGSAEGRWIRPETLVAPVLCSYHNELLAPLDRFGAAFVQELERCSESLDAGQLVSSVVGFFGPNFERWLLKALCGLIASSQAATVDGLRLEAVIPEWWVRCLFCEGDLVPGLGLYLDGTLGLQSEDVGLVSIGPVSTNSGVAGLRFQFRWFVGTLLLTDPGPNPTGLIHQNSVYRPTHLTLQNAHSKHRLEFKWFRTSGFGITLSFGSEVGA